MSNSPKLLKEEDASPIDDDEEFLTKNIRVLLVEADPNSLLVMNDLLTSLSYQVTSCNNGEDAISFLHKSKDEIDLVIWDYHMREVNVLQALNTIGKEMDLPVVITSHKHEKEIVTRSIMYGAYDFLVKPVSKEVMTVLWRHVFHKRMSKSGLDKPIDSYSVESDPDEEFGQSNEEEGSKNSAEHNTSDQKGTKKRMQWTPDLHAKFELAVKKIGNLENAVPKQILRCMQEEMNVEGLTRNNVASHLQKYRQGQVRQNALKNSSPLETQEDYRWSNGAHVALTASRPLPNFSMHHQSPPLNCSIQPPSNNYVTMNNMTNYYVTNTLPRVPYIDPFYTVQQQQHHHQPEHSYSSLQLPSGLLPPMDIHDLDDLIYDETLPCEPDSFPKGFNSFDGF